MTRISAREARALLAKPKRSKYGVRIDAAGKAARTVDGILFASKAEAKRWSELQLLERAGKISGLKRQVRFAFIVAGVHICDYVADFTYAQPGDAHDVTEDCKGFLTPEFKLKSKLFAALYAPRKIVEIRR